MSLALTQACTFQRAANDKLLTPEFKKKIGLPNPVKLSSCQLAT